MRPSRGGAAFVALAVLACARGAWAEEPPEAPDLVAVADPDFGMEGNVRTFMSFGRLLRRYEDFVPRVAPPGRMPVLGLGERLARMFLLDLPLANLETIVIHEVSGHGARGREFGKGPRFYFRLPAPYRNLVSPGDDEPNFASRQAPVASEDEDVAFGFGGVESNYVTAFWTNMNVVAAGGWMHVMDALVYVLSKMDYAGSFLGENLATKSADPSDDIVGYASDISNRFNQFTLSERRDVARRLQTAYVWNLVDPTLLWSMWATVDALGTGRRVTRVPLPLVRGHFVYPSPRFGLSPFGAEHYVDVFVAPARTSAGRRWVADVYGRVGSSGLASYVGAGAKVLEVPIDRRSRVRVGGELDVWSQPVIDRSARAHYDRPSSFGLNGAGYASVTLVGPLSLTGKLGYKSTGFVMGLPLGDGPHGYLGIALRP